MIFKIDERIGSSSIILEEWPLSQVLLKNNAHYPWLILVPRWENVCELEMLPRAQRTQLMDEISELSSIMRAFFKPDKLNIASLGNIVEQLHVHIVARFNNDRLWPHGIWQEALTSQTYEEDVLNHLIQGLKTKLKLSSNTLIKNQRIYKI